MPAKSAPKNSRTKGSIKIGEGAVQARTGKSWEEWFKTLDKAGAAKMQHAQIAELLYGKFKVSAWWSQLVSVRYEHERGIREAHQTCDGDFQGSVSKTIAAPLSELFNCFHDAGRRERWLKESGFTITKANAGKNIRIKWRKPESRIDVRFYSKGAEKAQVVVDQTALPDSESVTRMKAFWSQHLEKLRQQLEG